MTEPLKMRLARKSDLSSIIHLLADDTLGSTREDTSIKGSASYEKFFAAIETSPDNELWVVKQAGQVVGTWQVTYIPYLSHGGTLRCLIEAVRVKADRRGQGIGHQMMQFAIEQARARGCGMVQLTTDKSRTAAHRFYKNLGFTNSHEGMKLQLS